VGKCFDGYAVPVRFEVIVELPVGFGRSVSRIEAAEAVVIRSTVLAQSVGKDKIAG
jgi:hypothetical protein